MIIETTNNRFYRVEETNQEGLDHVWFGFEVKRTRDGFARKVRARRTLVRKEASRVVEA